MNSCGIIVEYNPFHNGHAYHAQMARKLSGADVIVAVMSGNFLQRGEPALLDKWTRAKEALANGVDLVIELPFCWSVQAADYFAKGAIHLLEAAGCTSLCFGTDSDPDFDYAQFGYYSMAHQAEIDRLFQALPQELSYPEKMTAVFRELYPGITLDFASPNHILGLSYAKENARCTTPMKLLPLARTGAGYLEKASAHPTIASATEIRQRRLDGRSLEQFVPLETAADLKLWSCDWEAFWPFLKYRLLSETPKALAELYQVAEGIEYRLKEAASSVTFAEFLERVKTRRYTRTRLQRLAVYLLANVTAEQIKRQQEHSALRILGFTEKGQDYLKQLKKQTSLPIITRFGKEAASEQALNLRADQIYQLAGASEQNFGRNPWRIGKK